MAKQDYQKLIINFVTFETEDILTLSVNDGAAFNAQDYGWWSTNNFMGGTEE